MIVRYAAGGGMDSPARAIQEPLQRSLGQTVVIDNMAGAGGALAHEFTAEAQPDGYTNLISSTSKMLYPYLVARLGYDPAELVPIGFIARQEPVFVGSADAPWPDLAAIVAAARQTAGSVQYGTAAMGTPMHLSTKRFGLLNNIKLTHVPSRGTSALVTDLLGGHVKLRMSSLTSIAQHLASGRLKAYAMAAPVRAAFAPDIKTFKELGFGDVDGTIHYTLVAPPRTSPAVIAKLNAALNASVATPDMREDLRKRGFVAMGGTAQELGKWMSEQPAIWGPVLRAAGIKPE